MVRRDDYEGCSFIDVLLELGAGHPSAQPAQHLENIRSFLGDLAAAAGVADPDAAQRMKSVAQLVLAQHT